MATALPVVCTAVGGLPSVLEEGVTGYLVDVAPAAVAAALRRLQADPAAARRMGQAAKQAAHRRFGAERMVADYMELYAQITKPNTR